MRPNLSSPTSLPGLAIAPTGGAQDTPEAGQDHNWLDVYFGTGSADHGSNQRPALDPALRIFLGGDPSVIIVATSPDAAEPSDRTPVSSVRRANAVANASGKRRPIQRLQVLRRGTGDKPVETGQDVPKSDARTLEIFSI